MNNYFFKSLLLLIGLILCQSVSLATKEPKNQNSQQQNYVKVPGTIVNDNVPPIPMEIQNRLKPYTEIKSTSFVDWDPRGQGMVVNTRLGNTHQLYWLDKPLGTLKPLTDFEEPVADAEFCPDMAKSYFVFPKDVGGAENYQYFSYDLNSEKSVMITDGKSRHMGLKFNHGGDRIAFVNNSRTGMLFDVYVMDPEKPQTVRIVYQATRSAYYIPGGWFKDDRHLIVTELLSANQANTLVVDTTSGKVTDVTPKSQEPQFFAMGMASKDGKYLYGISDRGSEFKKLVRLDRATLKVEIITKGIPWDIRSAAVSKDYRKAAFLANEGGIDRLYVMDMETLKYSPVPSLPEGLISGLKFDTQGKRLFLNLSNARMSFDAFHLELAAKKLVRWTKSDTGGLDLSKFPQSRLIHYPTFDCVNGKPRMIPAFYYRPAQKSDRPFPVLIDIHGGPEGQYRPLFQGIFNFFLNELEIAVIAPNVRGSSGYGKSYLLLDNAEKREDSVKDIGALLDWIARQPELDKKRVAVMGGSYGGYMVLTSMVHDSSRLACGVDIVGISNFVTFLKKTSPYRRDLRRAEYGDERKIGEFLNRISPSTNAQKIKKPLFVIQGKNDPRVPLGEAEQIVKTVRKNNVPVWYQVGTNEGHGFRKKDNRDFMFYAIVRFFQEYLLK